MGGDAEKTADNMEGTEKVSHFKLTIKKLAGR